MQLIRYRQPRVLVEIPDLVKGNTVIKQKARFENLEYSHRNERGIGFPGAPAQLGNDVFESVSIVVTILRYSATEDGGYGELLTGPGFGSFEYRIVAGADSMVDAATGEFVCRASDLTQENITEGGQYFGMKLMFEPEWFRKVAKNVPIAVEPTIIHKMQTHEYKFNA